MKGSPQPKLPQRHGLLRKGERCNFWNGDISLFKPSGAEEREMEKHEGPRSGSRGLEE